MSKQLDDKNKVIIERDLMIRDLYELLNVIHNELKSMIKSIANKSE